jgi:Arc/MetJ-type ribon-helix-helix transcriptional regulator
MTKTLVAIPDSLRKKLDAIRRREGLVLSECVRQALTLWLEHRKERGK